MNNFRDTRLIEAFEYIDPKYINEVGKDLKLRSVYSAEEEHTKPTFRTHLKQLVTLAACVLLLSLAIPTINYVLPRLGIFIGGTAGAGTTGFTENSTLQTESDTDIESTENSQTSKPKFQYSTVRIISDNNAFINPISVKIGYSLYKDDKSIWTEEIAGWQYIISNKDYKFENLPILTLDGDISSSAPENVSISNFQIFDSDWQRLDYTFAQLYELLLLPSGDYIVVGIEKEMIPYEQPHYVVGEYDYKLESSAAVFALSVTKQIESKKKLNYLRFIPELESIDDRIMHDVKNAWAEFKRTGIYTSNYQNYLYNGYTDNEAKTLAEKDANRAAEDAFPQFFDGSYFYYFGYLGTINDSVVLASYSGSGQPINGLTIGGVDFGFRARFYVYTDGKIISLEEAYDEKIISGDELLIIKNRNEQYIERAYDYYIIDDEQALEQ